MYKGFLKDETGAELAEYAVAVALLVAIALIVYRSLAKTSAMRIRKQAPLLSPPLLPRRQEFT